jgi:hypothetical protein
MFVSIPSEFLAAASAVSSSEETTSEFLAAAAVSSSPEGTIAEFHANTTAAVTSEETTSEFLAAAAAVATCEQTGGTTWYQVVERKAHHVDDDDTDTVVGLYLHEKEAVLGRETYQYLADKRAERQAAAANTNNTNNKDPTNNAQRSTLDL